MRVDSGQEFSFHLTHDAAVEMHRAWLRDPAQAEFRVAVVRELGERRAIGCWCLLTQRCHADNYREIIAAWPRCESCGGFAFVRLQRDRSNWCDSCHESALGFGLDDEEGEAISG